MIAMSFSSSILVWMKAFGMSTTATSRLSSASMMQVSSTDLVATVGELASSLLMKSRRLLRPATVRPLIAPAHFCLRNM
jgi:hypothetical protein